MSGDAPAIDPGKMGLLCEECGYTLSGLGEAANCPECGRPVSWNKGRRRLSAFEAAPSVRSFVTTTLAVLFRPAWFFKSMTIREAGRRGVWFARIHRGLGASLLGAAVSGHLVVEGSFMRWLRGALTPAGGFASYDTFTINLFGSRFYWGDEPMVFGLMIPPLALVIYVMVAVLMRVVGWMIARMAGLRRAVIRRGLGFCGVYLVVVAFALAATVGGYAWLIDSGRIKWQPWMLGPPAWDVYLGVACAGAGVGVAYLLMMGWMALRRLRYAND